MTFLDNGNESIASVEAITVGREGMTSPHVIIGSLRSGPEQSVVQVDAKAFDVPARRVVEEAIAAVGSRSSAKATSRRSGRTRRTTRRATPSTT